MTFDRISGGRVQIVCRVDEAGIPVCVCGGGCCVQVTEA